MLIQAIRDNDPVIFLEHKMLYSLQGEVPEELYTVPFGEANYVREGNDVTLVTYGRMVHIALEAAANLARQGIDCEVLDLRTTSPLDEDSILESVEKTGRLVVIDEFSELLTAKPDFAELFVAIGRIGRSIGVHLLLATQRLEMGKIRGLESHLSYRISLRTFSEGESREAIGVPVTVDARRQVLVERRRLGHVTEALPELRELAQLTLLVRQRAGDLLRGGGIVPEVGARRLFLERRDFGAQRTEVHHRLDLVQRSGEVFEIRFDIRTHNVQGYPAASRPGAQAQAKAALKLIDAIG
jgi:hypothetical protein